jgi:hypothetical protein
MKALILTLLLSLLSCDRAAKLESQGVGLRISNVQMEISHLNDIDWRIGKRREVMATQSIVAIVDLPRLRESELEVITTQKRSDAWILRLIVQRGSEKQDLGSLYAPFRPKRVSRSVQGGGAPSSVTVKIFYAAAYASERFRQLSCPAFAHNKRITSMAIEGENSPFEIVFNQSSEYREKSQLIELTPSAFNAGNSLVGQYFIEIAPYDTQNRTIQGSFKRLPMSIDVKSEEAQEVPSCAGVHQEYN